MKNLFLAVAIIMLFSTTCIADELDLDKETKYQKQIMETGFKILNANRIDKRITFRYINNNKVNAYAVAKGKNVLVFKGILPYFDDEDELAGIISHEIAHNIDFHMGFWKRLSMRFAPKKYEIKADKKAVDYMVNAGYDPIAMIIAMNKLTGEPCWFEKSSAHPKGSKRLAYVYEYIYKKYPAYLVDNQGFINRFMQFLSFKAFSRHLVFNNIRCKARKIALETKQKY